MFPVVATTSSNSIVWLIPPWNTGVSGLSRYLPAVYTVSQSRYCQIIRSREIVKLDGVTHININSNGNTELGRMLSNYSTYTIVHPKYGKIHTIEGLWCFLRSNKRLKWCLECPNGSKLDRSKIVDTWNGTQEQFRDEIKTAIELKIKTYKNIRTELINSDLPFTMYFINSRQKIRVPPVEWLVEYMEELRLKYKLLEPVHTSTL